MKLSFVIPAHNEEAYLGRCLASIKQELATVPDAVEVVVVCNACTDRTEAVARSFSLVKVVVEPAKGLVRARRAGYLAASGDLIANVDADTILPRGWLARVVGEFSRQPRLVALSGPFIYHDLSPWVNFWVRNFYYLGFATYLLNRFILRIGSMLQGGNFIVRRQALEAIGGYNLNFDFYGEDTDLARRLHAVGPVKFTFRLPMYASGRRLAGEGVVTMGLRYGLNYFWTTFFKKPFSQNSIDVRVNQS